MTDHKDYLGETLRLSERARENQYFRQLDHVLLERLRHAQAAPPVTTEEPPLFAKLLVPVDFSASSPAALRYAAAIAARCGAAVIVLHVMEAPADAATPALGEQREQTYTSLHALLPPQLASQAVELRVVSGHPFERILETAVQEAVGLIVLGTHGRTGLAHALLGSVAERVVRFAPCPVLTVKAGTAAEQAQLEEFYRHFMAPQTPTSALE